MGKETEISWADCTFNPWEGCTKVSPACANCYAEVLVDKRYGRVKWGGPRRRTSASNWRKPLTWNKRAQEAGRSRFVFCSSLADVGDEQVDDSWRDDLMKLVVQTPYLVWLFLTKRPKNLRLYLENWYALNDQYESDLANLWVGVTVEDQAHAGERLFELAHMPCVKRFVSCEPLLGPLDLTKVRMPNGNDLNALTGAYINNCKITREYGGWIGKLDWVIAGGESGDGARPTHPNWFRALRDQCAEHKTAFHFKQHGAWAPCGEPIKDPSWGGGAKFEDASGGYKTVDVLENRRYHTFDDGTIMERVGKRKSGAVLDGAASFARPEPSDVLESAGH